MPRTSSITKTAARLPSRRHRTPWRCSDDPSSPAPAAPPRSARSPLGVHARLDDLQRHLAPHRLFLLRHEHHAAAALANLLDDPIMSDPVSNLHSQGPILRCEPFQGLLKKVTASSCALMRRSTCLRKAGSPAQRLIKIHSTIFLRKLQRFGENDQVAVRRVVHLFAPEILPLLKACACTEGKAIRSSNRSLSQYSLNFIARFRRVSPT